MATSAMQRVVAWGAILVGLGAAFLAGLHVGVTGAARELRSLDMPVKASVLAAELRLLRQGEVKQLIEGKEYDIDAHVVRALDSSGPGWPWSLWLDDEPWERSLRYIAVYRREFPPVAPRFQPAAGAADPLELRKYAGKVEASTRALVERYGQ